jgi:hypothetical protein
VCVLGGREGGVSKMIYVKSAPCCLAIVRRWPCLVVRCRGMYHVCVVHARLSLRASCLRLVYVMVQGGLGSSVWVVYGQVHRPICVCAFEVNRVLEVYMTHRTQRYATLCRLREYSSRKTHP